MKRFFVVISTYLIVLLVCVCFFALIGNLFGFSTGANIGVGIWILFCFCTLLVPDELSERAIEKVLGFLEGGTNE